MRILREVLVSKGTLTASLVHPRGVFRDAIRAGAAGIILAHNHPSGDPTPSQEDRDYVKSLMVPCTEPGKIANWIAAPPKGINGQPFEFDYVRL